MDKALTKEIKGNILELGCGWGGIACYLAKKYPENQVIAYENSYIPWLFSSVRAFLSKTVNLKIVKADFYKVPFNDAGLVYCYLHTKAMKRLNPKFNAELPSHSIVISHTFSIPGWRVHQNHHLGGLFNSDLLIYITKDNT